MKALVTGSVASFALALAVLAQTPSPPAPGSPAPPAPVSPAATAIAAAPSASVSASVAATPAASGSVTNEFADKIKQRTDRKFKKHGVHIQIGDEDEGVEAATHGSNDDFPLAAIPIAIIAMLSVFGAPVAIVAVIMLISWAKTRSLHRTVRAMVEKGQPVPPELLASPAGAPLRPWYDLRRGIVLLAVGFGIVMFFGISAGWDNGVWALGLIPGLIGLGYIFAWRLANKHANGFKV